MLYYPQKAKEVYSQKEGSFVMRRLWKLLAVNCGKKYTEALFRGVFTFICAAIVALPVLMFGFSASWDLSECLWSAFLTGGYAGVAGYLISIFYELNHVKREAE